jgi:hypothetical protein
VPVPLRKTTQRMRTKRRKKMRRMRRKKKKGIPLLPLAVAPLAYLCMPAHFAVQLWPRTRSCMERLSEGL